MDGYGSSMLEQWTWLLWAIESSPHRHERILDVGAGHGKAAVLIREYLNIKPNVISAVEPNEGAPVHGKHSALYDVVWSYTAQDFPWWDDFDTVLLADVIEHMPFSDGRAMLDKIRGQIIISTPVNALASDNEGVPPLEQHVSQWRPSHFQATGRLEKRWDWPTVDDGSKPPQQYIVRLGPR